MGRRLLTYTISDCSQCIFHKSKIIYWELNHKRIAEVKRITEVEYVCHKMDEPTVLEKYPITPDECPLPTA